ncbi:MAG: hypothetical protein HKN15_01420 [Xanthomonadales bacterium]|nr:hypothetical protein [Xanthomonadales bacterium]
MKMLARYILPLMFLLTSGAQAADEGQPVRWERDAAVNASVDARAAGYRSQLRSSLRTADAEATLGLLQHLQSSAELSAPARERLVFEFVEDLRQEPPGSVHEVVLEYLKQYPVTVMVAHHDHPDAHEPLFNIPTATYGVINHWTRQQAAFEGATMLTRNAASLVQAYRESSDPAQRRGFIDALATADPMTLMELNRVALGQLSQVPELTALAGHSALLAGDLESLQALAAQGSGPGLNEVLRHSAARLDGAQREGLLEAALASNRPGNAALAIAHLGTGVTTNEKMMQMLVRQLDDPQLGAAAALTLSRNPSPTLNRILAGIGQDQGAGLAASRARLALQLMDDLPSQEAPR